MILARYYRGERRCYTLSFATKQFGKRNRKRLPLAEGHNWKNRTMNLISLFSALEFLFRRPHASPDDDLSHACLPLGGSIPRVVATHTELTRARARYMRHSHQLHARVDASTHAQTTPVHTRTIFEWNVYARQCRDTPRVDFLEHAYNTRNDDGRVEIAEVRRYQRG